MTIGAMVEVVPMGRLYLSFYIQGERGYKKGNRDSYNIISIRTLSLLVYVTYIFTYNFLCLGEHVMVFWKVLDGGPSHNGPLLRPFESLRGGTPGTNPHHRVPESVLLQKECKAGDPLSPLLFVLAADLL
jgi:hypothetical protein